MVQGMFFVFGTFVLFGLSFFCDKQREFKNKYLGLFILWSLAGVFIHTFNVGLTTGMTAGFLNFCLMSEGFIYVLCACLLFWLIVSFSKNFKIAYPVLIISSLNLVFVILQKVGLHPIWLNTHSICGLMGIAPHLVIFSAIAIPILWKLYEPLSIIPIISLVIGSVSWNNSFTGLIALLLALEIYLVLNRRYIISWLLGIIFICYCIHFYPLMLNKLSIRMEVWIYAIKEITQHPFIGWGFDNSLNMNMVNAGHGFMYRHNDYLNIARDLGLPFLITGIIFLKSILHTAKKDWLFLSVMIVLISACTWTSFYFARLGVIAIVLLALIERKKWKVIPNTTWSLT